MSVLVRNGVSATAAVRMGMLRAFGLGPSLHQRAASFCQYGARLDLLGNSFDLAPLLHQGAPAPRVALVGQTKADDPIGSKVPIVLAQLAPRRQHAAAIEEAEHDRPDRSPRALTLGVGILEDELALRADRLPYRGEIDPLFLRLGSRPRKQAAVVHALAQVVRAAILAMASAAARASGSSVRCATHRDPRTRASISSSENIRGGSTNPGRSTWPTPASPSIEAPWPIRVWTSR